MGIKIGLRRKRVVAFTALSIALSVSLLYTALAINSDLAVTSEHYIRSTTTPIDISISSTRWGNPISEEMRNEILLDYRVRNVIPRIEENIQVANGSGWYHLLLCGIDFEAERHIGNLNVVAGTSNISSTQCYLTNIVMDMLSLEIGDSIEIETEAGRQWLNVSGYGNVVDKGIFGPVIFIPIETAWDIFGIRYPHQSTNKLLIEVIDVFQIPNIVNTLSATYGETFIVSNQKSYSLWIATTFLSQTQLILITLTAAAFLVAILRISTSFLSIFAATKFETGVLRAMGAEKSNVFLLLLAEISVVGILGSSIGIIIGIGMGYFSSFLTTQVLTLQNPGFSHLLLQSPHTINIPLLFWAYLIGLVLTIIAGMLPAWVSSHDSIVDSLNRSGTRVIVRPENIDSRFMIIWNILKLVIILFCCLVAIQILTDIFHLGLINLDSIRILALPAIFILVALYSRRISQPSRIRELLTRRSSEVVHVISSRNLKRRATAAMLVFNLFVTISLLFFVSTNVSYSITNSWEKTLGERSSSANVMVYVDESSALGIMETIESMDSISNYSEIATTYKYLQQGSQVEFGVIFGIHPDTFPQLASIGLIDSTDNEKGFSLLEKTNSCIISEYATNKFGLELGEEITAARRANLTIVGICESSVPVFMFSTFNPFFIFINADDWSSVTGDDFRPNGILIESTDPEDVVSHLSGISGVFPILISEIKSDYSYAVQSIRTMLDIAIIFLLVITLLTAVISGFSVSTTRRHEIGIILSLGLDRKEIAKIYTLENIVPMIAGSLWGIVAGLFSNIALSDVIMRFTGGLFTLFDPILVILLGFSLVVSIAATYYSILHFSNVTPVELLNEIDRF